MFRLATAAFRSIRPILKSNLKEIDKVASNEIRHYSIATIKYHIPVMSYPWSSLSNNRQILDLSKHLMGNQVRSVTKFSLNKGKRKTVKVAVMRFFRLHWGGWIRPKVGRHKHLWKKSSDRKRKLREHVFCNSTQSWMLDKMVTKYWKRPKYYINDPYSPYHTREEFHITRKKPLP